MIRLSLAPGYDQQPGGQLFAVSELGGCEGEKLGAFDQHAGDYAPSLGLWPTVMAMDAETIATYENSYYYRAPMAFDTLAFTVVEDSVRAFIHGGRKLRIIYIASTLLVFLGLPLAIYGIQTQQDWFKGIGSALVGIGTMSLFLLGAYQRTLDASAKIQVIEEIEQRVRTHPEQPQAAWDLARVKLESYLNRNLRDC